MGWEEGAASSAWDLCGVCTLLSPPKGGLSQRPFSQSVLQGLGADRAVLAQGGAEEGGGQQAGPARSSEEGRQAESMSLWSCQYMLAHLSQRLPREHVGPVCCGWGLHACSWPLRLNAVLFSAGHGSGRLLMLTSICRCQGPHCTFPWEGVRMYPHPQGAWCC